MVFVQENNILPDQYQLEIQAQRHYHDTVLDMHQMKDNHGSYYEPSIRHTYQLNIHADRLAQTFAPEENEFRASEAAHESIYYAYRLANLLVPNAVELDDAVYRDFELHRHTMFGRYDMEQYVQRYFLGHTALHDIVGYQVENSSTPRLTELSSGLALMSLEEQIRHKFIDSQVQKFKTRMEYEARI